MICTGVYIQQVYTYYIYIIANSEIIISKFQTENKIVQNA